jgi:hypothetical protein
MDISALLNDKSLKAKAQTEILSKWLLDNPAQVDELLVAASRFKDPAKATCIEALEFATKQVPGVANANCLQFVTQTLTVKAPRVKWESAKVIGNIAHLLANADHEGTVVRWSAAFALGEIIKLKTVHNDLLFQPSKLFAPGKKRTASGKYTRPR